MDSRLHISFTLIISEVSAYLTIVTCHDLIGGVFTFSLVPKQWHFLQLMPFRYDGVQMGDMATQTPFGASKENPNPCPVRSEIRKAGGISEGHGCMQS